MSLSGVSRRECLFGTGYCGLVILMMLGFSGLVFGFEQWDPMVLSFVAISSVAAALELSRITCGVVKMAFARDVLYIDTEKTSLRLTRQRYHWMAERVFPFDRFGAVVAEEYAVDWGEGVVEKAWESLLIGTHRSTIVSLGSAGSQHAAVQLCGRIAQLLKLSLQVKAIRQTADAHQKADLSESETIEDYQDAESALEAAADLDMLGDWDHAVSVYESAAAKWPEHREYVDACIRQINDKRTLS